MEYNEKYEAAQPDKVIDNIVNKIESGKTNDLKISSSKRVNLNLMQIR